MNFREWCDYVGGTAAVSQLMGGKSMTTIRAWYRGDRIPRHKEAQNIIQASDGLLDYNRIYQSFE